MKQITITRIFAWAFLFLMNFQAFSSATQPPLKKSVSLPVKKTKKKTLKAPLQTVDELALINAAKHFKLSVNLMAGTIACMKDDATIKSMGTMLEVIKAMPMDIFIDTLNHGNKKQAHFEKNMPKTLQTQKFDREFDALLRKSGLEDDYLKRAYQAWAQHNGNERLVKLLTKNKDVKTLGELLENV